MLQVSEVPFGEHEILSIPESILVKNFKVFYLSIKLNEFVKKCKHSLNINATTFGDILRAC